MQTSYDYTQPEAVLGLVTEDFTKYVDTVVPQTAVKIGKLLTADKTAGKVRNAAKLPAAAGDITKPGALEGEFDETRTREIRAMGRKALAFAGKWERYQRSPRPNSRLK